ncbi:tetratricopeptide repeat protein [Nocardioides sp. W3-2-3]|nr:tetratricopeptide repeat protein [Nocardioides convexus]
MRKAAVLAILGRFAEAAALLEQVVAALDGNPVWQARARIWRAHACRNLGHLDEAEREVRAADESVRRDRLVVGAGLGAGEPGRPRGRAW